MKRTFIAVAIVLGIAGAGYALYEAGVRKGASQSPIDASAVTTGAATDRIDPKTGRRVLYWHDPMVPGQKFDKPGKSPFMDMELVPVLADEAASAGNVAIDSRLSQNLGIRTADVVHGRLEQPIDTVGTVAFNDRDVAVVQARASGWIERLHVRAPLDPVKKGDVLAELYVPDWVAAQEEFFTVKRMQLGDRLLDGARQRMRLAGMSDGQIALVESTGTVQPRLQIVAPISGVVAELAAREGMTVMPGAMLFRLNGLGTVWVNAEVPEMLSGSIRPGMAVEATTAALPGRTFKGRVGAVLPEVNASTRTLKARVELANSGGELVPGMFANVAFIGPKAAGRLLVPSEAVIRTGRRTMVMVALGDGRFAPADVETGAEANGQTEIRKGLMAGQKVVASGQFLIDSEASLKGVETRMRDPEVGSGTTPLAKGDVHRATGRVDSIQGYEIMLEHGPVPSLKWPSMTMGFRLPSGAAPKGVKTGDAVDFEFRQAADGQYEIVTIARSSPAASRAPAPAPVLPAAPTTPAPAAALPAAPTAPASPAQDHSSHGAHK